MVFIEYLDDKNVKKSIKFLMKTKEAEINLVDKFNNGLVRSSQILNLGQLGQVKVGSIKSMIRLENTETVHKSNVHGTSILENTLNNFNNVFKRD